MPEQEDTIDLAQVMTIIKYYKYRFIGIIAIAVAIAIGVALLLPKQYESTVLLRAKTSKAGSGISLQAASALALLGGGSAASPTQSYMELMKSRTVLEPVMGQVDMPPKVRETITAEAFAKACLDIKNTKGTDLIQVKAKGKSPEEARFIAQSVVDSFQIYLTQQSRTEQSYMAKFLQDRMIIAKQEMERAEHALEAFQQQSKVYVPDEQAKALLKQITEIDTQLAAAKVKNDANGAKLQEINGQLSQQNAAIINYNVTENPAIQKIKEQIIEKELKLIELKQHFTDKHPDVVLAETEINQLKDKMNDELGRAVQSGAATLNPVQAKLLGEKVATETELMAGQATATALQQIVRQNDQQISSLSSNSMTYIGLERQVKITQEVYAVLVKNYEQTRIQEAMDSMDVQVVDPADTPKTPSAPKKRLIASVGFVIGLMLDFLYLIVIYLRSTRRHEFVVGR